MWMTMNYLIRFVHQHQTFREPEIRALAELAGVNIEIVNYDNNSPHCIVRLESDDAAKALIERSILAQNIYELWGDGEDYRQLHESVKTSIAPNRAEYKDMSFRFTLDSFQGKRSPIEKRELIESFNYLDFRGEIKMNNAQLEVCIFEEYEMHALKPKMVFLGRWVAKGTRDVVGRYNLKRRRYIARTSMDAELSLITANLTLAAPGKIFYDPFVGTGSFAVSCAHFGAATLGSDIDGRSIRGSPEKSLLTNFAQYALMDNFLDSFVADITHMPLKEARLFDGIICDPPYGVREGPRVLGYREGKEAQLVMIDGVPAHLRDGYVPPKRPYGFDDMLQDILDLGALMLVDFGRLSMWVPTANDENEQYEIPLHPALEVVSICVQDFNTWSRRLLTYQKIPEKSVQIDLRGRSRKERAIGSADELNPFRKKYFEGFKTIKG